MGACHVLTKTEIGVMQLQAKGPRMAGNNQKLGEGPGKTSSPEPWGGANPANTLSSDSGLQNCEKINHCHFKQSSLWDFVIATLGD